MSKQQKRSTEPRTDVGLSDAHLDAFAAGGDSGAIARHRRQGADISADSRRASVGNRLKRAAVPVTVILGSAALLLAATYAAGSETDHAPRAPAHLAHPDTPPPPPAPDRSN